MTFQPGSRLHLVLAGGGHAIFWIAVGVVARWALLLVLSRYELRLISHAAWPRRCLGLRTHGRCWYS